MKIGIDIQTTLGQKTGFGFYVKNLVDNLKKIDKKNKYFFFKPEKEKDLSTPQRLIWDQIHVSHLAKKNKVDILHQPCFSAPILHGRMKVVVTIHDLIAIRFAKDIPFFSRQYFGRWMPFSYHWADKIICDSYHTKKDVINFLKVPEDRIQVIHLAASEQFNSNIKNEKVQKIRKKYGIGNKYLLHTGTLNPRKNLKFLIRVFSQIIKKFPDLQLVIAGKKGWYYEGLFRLVKELSLEKKIIFVGYVPDEDAPVLCYGAEIFVFPSLYEGFGFPPLEAMTSGVPVISSNASSLPEVIGEGGILLDPKDAASWIRAIERVLSDIKFKKRLVEKGLKQSKKFSWGKCAEETLKVYEELYKEK